MIVIGVDTHLNSHYQEAHMADETVTPDPAARVATLEYLLAGILTFAPVIQHLERLDRSQHEERHPPTHASTWTYTDSHAAPAGWSAS
jgi:hypothetical protein